MPMQPSPSAETFSEPSCRDSIRTPEPQRSQRSQRVLSSLCPLCAVWLELSAQGRRPPFDHDFLLRVEIDRVAALLVEIAEEAVFPSREGEVGHRRRDPDVDADVARPGLVPELPRGGAARRE